MTRRARRHPRRPDAVRDGGRQDRRLHVAGR